MEKGKNNGGQVVFGSIHVNFLNIIIHMRECVMCGFGVSQSVEFLIS